MVLGGSPADRPVEISGILLRNQGRPNSDASAEVDGANVRKSKLAQLIAFNSTICRVGCSLLQ